MENLKSISDLLIALANLVSKWLDKSEAPRANEEPDGDKSVG